MTQISETKQAPAERTVAEQANGAEATRDDVYHAFRLLLGRDPDAAALELICRAVVDHRMTPTALADGIMASPEFALRGGRVPLENAPVEVRMDGFSLFARPEDYDIGQSIRQHEPHVVAMLHQFLRPGDVFVDIGANIGLFTNLAARLVGDSGFVLAVEPMDKNIQLIHRALEHNGFGHVRVEACAASDRNGRVAIASHRGTSNGHVVRPGTAGLQLVFAQTRRLDDLAADLPRIDLVKFDIEGCELLAWRGFRNSLEKHRPRVLTEFHPHCMRTFIGVEPRDYLDTLFEYGGELYVLSADGKRIPCKTPEDVMRCWDEANRASAADGKNHLDLFVVPRS